MLLQPFLFRIKRGEGVKRKKVILCVASPPPAQKVYSILSRRRNAARGALYFFRVGGAFFHSTGDAPETPERDLLDALAPAPSPAPAPDPDPRSLDAQRPAPCPAARPRPGEYPGAPIRKHGAISYRSGAGAPPRRLPNRAVCLLDCLVSIARRRRRGAACQQSQHAG